MINSFENYLKEGKAKTKTPDFEEARALLEKAEKRVDYIKIKVIGKDNAQFILEDAYESVREAAQSLMSVKGFKPYSHEATISFIKKFYNFKEEEIYDFDRFRQIRNNSVNKAEPVNIEDAKNSLIFAIKFIKEIKTLHKKELL